jgi:hypothetical protein
LKPSPIFLEKESKSMPFLPAPPLRAINEHHRTGGRAMKSLKLLLVAVFVVALMVGGSMGYAEEAPSGEAAKGKWEFAVIPSLALTHLSS